MVTCWERRRNWESEGANDEHGREGEKRRMDEGGERERGDMGGVEGELGRMPNWENERIFHTTWRHNRYVNYDLLCQCIAWSRGTVILILYCDSHCSYCALLSKTGTFGRGCAILFFLCILCGGLGTLAGIGDVLVRVLQEAGGKQALFQTERPHWLCVGRSACLFALIHTQRPCMFACHSACLNFCTWVSQPAWKCASQSALSLNRLNVGYYRQWSMYTATVSLHRTQYASYILCSRSLL